MQTDSIAAINHAREVRAVIEAIEAERGARFYGLANTTRKGPRNWSVAPRAPKRAIQAIAGPARDLPETRLLRWAADAHAWRTIDLTTVNRIWFRDERGVRREYKFKPPRQ